VPRQRADGSKETDEEVFKRYSAENKIKDKMARQNTWRRSVSKNSYRIAFPNAAMQKFDQQLRIIECQIQLSVANGPESDLKEWLWLKELLQYLGTDGMSSDDTEISAERVVYRVRIQAWHQQEIANYMQIIETERLMDVRIMPARGSKPINRDRKGSNPIMSNRKPITGLPLSIYDEEWVEKQSQQYRQLVLCVSKEQFNWMAIEARARGLERR
jgi:hypothetical protein